MISPLFCESASGSCFFKSNCKMEELPVTLDAQEPLHPDDMKALHDMYLKDKSNAQVKFNYAWGLVRSLSKGDQKKGVDLLHGT